MVKVPGAEDEYLFGWQVWKVRLGEEEKKSLRQYFARTELSSINEEGKKGQRILRTRKNDQWV